MGSPHGSEAGRLEGYPTGQAKLPTCRPPGVTVAAALGQAGSRAGSVPGETVAACHEKRLLNWCSLVHNGRMSTTTPPPSIRLTIPVEADVHATFQRLAKAGNMSTGRAMGEWLKDTMEAAELMASTMERARAAPKIVTAELHAMMLGMTDQTKELMDKFSKMKGASEGASGKRSAPRPDGPLGALIPPSCNTGGKVPSGHKAKPTRGKP